MAHIIRSYHPEARLPESEAELAGLYRSVLSDKRVLLLMDNAASREQVERLIPPPGSLLLVTSRFHFALPGLVSRDLDGPAYVQMGKLERALELYEERLSIAREIGDRRGVAEDSTVSPQATAL